MRVIIGSDHAGLDLKQAVTEHLIAAGHEVVDLGAHERASVDYPDFAVAVANEVASSGDFGILCCGTGQGMAMTANRVPGVRAAVVSDCFSAVGTRAHNDANVLCMGQRVIGVGLACTITDAFLGATFEGGRHQRRVNKIESNTQSKAAL